MNEVARWLDGNALGGLLQELFGSELTDKPHTCQSCGACNLVATHRLYRGSGLVLRCPACGAIAMVVAKLRDRYVVHMTGTWRLEIAHSWRE
jgi:ribosomal protein S27AE